MFHAVKPYEHQWFCGIDRRNPTAAETAIELRFPQTFSEKSRRLIRYLAGTIHLYAYKGKFVVTDESRVLTKCGDGTEESPFGEPRFVCKTLSRVDHQLRKLADFYDKSGELTDWAEKPWNKEYPESCERRPENVKVTMQSDEDFIGFSTYDRLHGGHGRFFISSDKLSNLLEDSRGTVLYDGNDGDFVRIVRLEEALWFSFTWLSSYGDGFLNGARQDVEIPFSKIRERLDTYGTTKYLHRPKGFFANIVHTYASSTIHEILQDKRVRNAFCKAMRDEFQWPGDQVTLYPDGKYSFFFKTRSGCPKCGGLILHEGECEGLPCVYYSIHT